MALSEAEKKWVRQFPVQEMIHQGLLAPCRRLDEKLAELFRFFEVGSIEGWEKLWQKQSSTQFRKMNSLNGNAYKTSAWLYCGVRGVREEQRNKFDLNFFKNSLQTIRTLTNEPLQTAFDELKDICLQSGVVIVLTDRFNGLGISGATQWIDETPVIQLTDLFKRHDRFWFTFFHEAAHIILHKGENFIEAQADDYCGNAKEEEANDFAADLLNPPKYYQQLIESHLSEANILRYAEKVNIHPGIVVGRLARDGRIDYTEFQDMSPKIELVNHNDRRGKKLDSTTRKKLFAEYDQRKKQLPTQDLNPIPQNEVEALLEL